MGGIVVGIPLWEQGSRSNRRNEGLKNWEERRRYGERDAYERERDWEERNRNERWRGYTQPQNYGNLNWQGDAIPRNPGWKPHQMSWSQKWSGGHF